MAYGDLTDLAKVKLYMGITDASKDALITQLIPQLSAGIARYCDRQFYLTIYRDFIYTEGGKILYLPQKPVKRLKRLVRRVIEVMAVKVTKSGLSGATVAVNMTDLVVIMNEWGSAEAEIEIDLTVATDLAAVKAAIETEPGWSANIYSGYLNHAAGDLIEMPGQPALNPDYAELMIPDYDTLYHDYILEDESGRVKSRSGFPNEGRIFAEWEAGYGTDVDDLPADLVGLATAILADAVREASTDKGMKSEKLGDYSYTKFDNQVTVDEFVVERYSEQLARFRRVSL